MNIDVFTAESFHAHSILRRRLNETVLLACASLLVLFFVWRVSQAKAPLLDEAARQIESGEILILERNVGLDRLQKSLAKFDDLEQRAFIAKKISEYARLNDPLPNVGALGLILVTDADLKTDAARAHYAQRLAQSSLKRIRMLTADDLSDRVKPFFAVRTPEEFRTSLWWSLASLLVAFWIVHSVWILVGSRADGYLLPILLALSGTGFTVMISLRDPVRDRLSFAAFGDGVVAGCFIMLAVVVLSFLMSLRLRGSLPQWLSPVSPVIDFVSDLKRRLVKRNWLPLYAAVALSALLVVFGSGPAGSAVKVRLGLIQPVDVLRLLVVFFLASYFGQRWEFLRKLREKRVWPLLNLPRIDHAVPVILGIGAMILFFFLQRDLGPAMVLAALFLCLYAVARNRLGLVLGGAGLFVFAIFVGYEIGYPAVAAARVRLWLWPWNNGLAEGEQIVQALWAMASGGLSGLGLGHGSPSIIPEAHTDMILPALAEEVGLIGLLLVLGLFAILIGRSLRITYRAATPYSFFLALGLTLSIALQLILIAAGTLGLFPLSGVVTPFLSYGKASAIVNFLSIGLLLAISDDDSRQTEFRSPLTGLAAVLGIVLVIIAVKATWVQVVKADEIAVSGAVIMQSDGSYTMRYNPRLRAIDRRLERGSIYDRNGVPMATSDCKEIVKWRNTYAGMGVKLDPTCSGDEIRHYPLGPAAFHLLGDLDTMHRWTASNTAFEEKRSRAALTGWDDHENYVQVNVEPSHQRVWVRTFDYSPLLPILKKGFDSQDADVRKVVDATRRVRLSIDARLQARVSTAFARHLEDLHKPAGAVVVLKPATGEILASVSLPLSDKAPDTIDTARFGQYAPGSSLKILTAIAALRHDPSLVNRTYMCGRLPNGRVGAVVRGVTVRDDVLDEHPHGTLRMPQALALSCNAWFAQLGTEIGTKDLLEAAQTLNIQMATPNTEQELQKFLPQSSYGQGEVVVTPLRMARLAGVIANAGVLAPQRVRLEPPEQDVREDTRMLAAAEAAEIASAMRQAVTSGTGTAAASSPVAIAGKTGTAELSNAASHAWFIGYLPAGAPPARRIAFAILVVNGGYGGRAAAPFAPVLAGILDDLKLR